jgi:acyl dehydratase
MLARAMTTSPHDRFSRRVHLDVESVRRVAELAGDANPLHHDAEYAAGTRFGRPIASAAQTAGLLMGATASHFAAEASMVGLDFSFRFRRPVPAGETVDIEWLVVARRPSARLGGDVVDLRGRLRTSAGETAVGARGRVLLFHAAGASDSPRLAAPDLTPASPRPAPGSPGRA